MSISCTRQHSFQTDPPNHPKLLATFNNTNTPTSTPNTSQAQPQEAVVGLPECMNRAAFTTASMESTSTRQARIQRVSEAASDNADKIHHHLFPRYWECCVCKLAQRLDFLKGKARFVTIPPHEADIVTIPNSGNGNGNNTNSSSSDSSAKLPSSLAILDPAHLLLNQNTCARPASDCPDTNGRAACKHILCPRCTILSARATAVSHASGHNLLDDRLKPAGWECPKCSKHHYGTFRYRPGEHIFVPCMAPPRSSDEPVRCYLRTQCAGKCSASPMGFEQQQEAVPTRQTENPATRVPDAGRYVLNRYGERLCQVSDGLDQNIILGHGQLLTWHMERTRGTVTDIMKRAKSHPKPNGRQQHGKKEHEEMTEAKTQKKKVEDEISGVSFWIDEVRAGAGWVLFNETKEEEEEQEEEEVVVVVEEEVEHNRENDCGRGDNDE